MEFRTYRRARAWISVLATALARAGLAAEPSLPAQEFHVPAGDATRTLTDLSRQAHLQLLFDYNVVKGHTTPPLDGVFTPGDALRRLLAGTDLAFDFVNERTLAVMQKPSPERPKPEPAEAKAEPVTPPAPKRHISHSAPPSGTVEVVRVTGTYVRDEPPVGEEIISATRADIEATGSATPADFLRTLPQVFGGGPNQDTHIGQETTTNSGLGVGVNLRGLGARATLVLINGRRVAPSGTEGEFVDVENIPLSAIERIDILPDSASATYGADAVGGVVNFVLRDKFDGAETIARGGSGTRGDLQEYLFSQTLGTSWDGGHGLVSFEFYDRGALPAADRAYAVSDLRPFGGNNWNTNYTNPGNIVDPRTGQTYAIPPGQNGTHLTAADLIPGTQNLQNRYIDAQIIPSQQRWTLYASGHQALGERLSLFTDVLLGHREAAQNLMGAAVPLQVPNTNAFYVNPTGARTAIVVDYNFGKDLGPLAGKNHIDTLNATVGLDIDAGAAWTARTLANYSREMQNNALGGEPDYSALAVALADPNPLTAFNPFGAGSNTNPATLQGIRTAYRFWLDSQLKTVDLTADGPLVVLPAGPLKLALGADWREQLLATTTVTPGSPGAADSSLSRSVSSAFAQIVAPVFSERNAKPALRRLELSAAARYESYSGYGGSVTPKYGVVWSPLEELVLRGTWSRAMRPPTLTDLDASQNRSAILPVKDPTAAAGMTTALFWSGGNPSVRPEHAESWTAGFDFAPAWLSGFSLDATYFRTNFTGRIQSTSFYSTATLLTDPIYAAIITRGPSASQINYVCTHSIFYQQGTAAQCMSAPIGALVDLRVRNLGALLTDGIDLEAAYARTVSFGNLKFNVGGTWLRDFSVAQTPDQPLVPLLNTQNEPINLRLRASTDWQYGGWGALLAANFTNSYRDTASVPQRRVDSWTTIDAQARYDFPANSWLRGLRVEINAQNVFNVDPPFLNNGVTNIGYDQENANPYGRILSLQLRKQW